MVKKLSETLDVMVDDFIHLTGIVHDFSRSFSCLDAEKLCEKSGKMRKNVGIVEYCSLDVQLFLEYFWGIFLNYFRFVEEFI